MSRTNIPLHLVDTNVAIVANGGSKQAPESLEELCIETLLNITKNGGLVMDKEQRIFGEYLNKLSLSGQPGTGDMFLKWVHQNQWNPERCEMRSITCTNEDSQEFEEFPEHTRLVDFDVSDRKFIATANAGAVKVPILQAVDFKWWGWRDALKDVGIDVIFLDETLAEEQYNHHLTSSHG